MKIKPTKPKMFQDKYSAIFLKRSEVDISEVKLVALKNHFDEQVERHITITGGITEDAINKKMEEMGSEKAKKLFTSEIKALLGSFDWIFTPKDIYWVKKKGTFGRDIIVAEEREAFIRAVEMPDMEKFYQKLNKLLETNIATQFPHITLFAKTDRRDAPWMGIPIPSADEFKRLNPIKLKDYIEISAT